MPNYGFAIDLRKCIGCHACTIACKAEHEIPVGVNRCWVKTVEKGTFPDTRRFFFPVLCNQCDEAPCVKICPTNALFKRRDGIVDLHGDSLHRLPRLHGRVPVRSAVHRSEHAHRREVQLLREPRREQAAAGVRQRLPDRVPDLRRPRRSRRAKWRRSSQREAITRAQAREGHGPEGVLHRRRRQRDPAGDRRRGRSSTRKARCMLRPLGCARRRIRRARRRARRLRHAARQAVGRRHGALPAHEGHRHRRDAARARCCWLLGVARAADAVVGAGDLAASSSADHRGVLVVDLERPERFYYILVAPELAIVDGVGRVLPHRARR